MRRRLYIVASLLGVLLLIASLVLWVLSNDTTLRYEWGNSAAGVGHVLLARRGAVGYRRYWGDRPAPLKPGQMADFGVIVSGWDKAGFRYSKIDTVKLATRPSAPVTCGQETEFWFELGWVALLSLPLSIRSTLLLARRSLLARARDREGRCDACGYDLTGNTSGVCPECGTDIPRKAEA